MPHAPSSTRTNSYVNLRSVANFCSRSMQNPAQHPLSELAREGRDELQHTSHHLATNGLVPNLLSPESAGYLQGTARLILHSPVSLSGGTKLMNGGSSSQLTFKLNCSPTVQSAAAETSSHKIGYLVRQ